MALRAQDLINPEKAKNSEPNALVSGITIATSADEECRRILFREIDIVGWKSTTGSTDATPCRGRNG